MTVEPFQPYHVLYVAGYGAKSCNDRQHIDLLDLYTGEVVHGPRRMRTSTCSGNFGDTMKQVKAAQRVWVLEQLAVEEAERIDQRAEPVRRHSPPAPAEG